MMLRRKNKTAGHANAVIENGVINKSLMMKRAWSMARQLAGKKNGWGEALSLRDWFAQALREIWAEVKAAR
ncbi:hypothetical protein [Entomohabitans teleogrylli]|uniref:hypothetical protein n=1 Tax=Entomohabitans teleogrylli TaxID=1384589 RepID=UPI00073D3F7D|nr:hypothetical protein [Entomohabitans teleogrylli]